MRVMSSGLVILAILPLVAACTDTMSLDAPRTSAPAASVAASQSGPSRPASSRDQLVTVGGDQSGGGDYRFRLIGGERGPTTLFFVLADKGSEQEYFVDRCNHVDTDEFLPEGLLMPVLCDGRRIVLVEEDGHYVVRGGGREVTVPTSG